MERWSERAFWASCGVLAAFGVTAMAMPHQLSYAEGYMLEQAARLAQGGPLYRSRVDPPWVLDNFPPLWTAVLALGVKLFGPTFQFGRALTLAATAGLTILLLAFHRRLGTPRWASLGAAALWLLAPFVLWRSTLVRMDLPALVMAALGFWVYLRHHERRPRTALAGASLLFAAAVLSRQTMLVAPAAATAGLLLVGRRRHALMLAATTAAVLAVAVAVLQHATDGAFLRHVVTYNTGRYSLAKLPIMMGRLAAGHAAILAFGAIGAWGAWRSRDDTRRILAVWAMFEAAASFTVGKPGAAVNHFLPLLFVAALHAAAGAQSVGAWWARRERTRHHVPSASHARPLTVLLLLQLALLPVPAAVMTWHVAGTQDEEAQLVALLRDDPGPILSENAGAALQAGHEVLLEPRLVLEQYAIGRWDDATLVAAIARQEYSLIVTQDMPDAFLKDGFRFTPGAWAMLHERYDVAQTIGRWQVWEPRALDA